MNVNVGVVVFCPPELLQRALAWGGSGLVARSLWVSTEETAQVDPDAPNEIDAHWITPTGVEGPVRLAETLHGLGALDELRLAWVRSPEDEVAEQIKAVEQLLHEMMAPDQQRRVDIIVPSRRTDAKLVALPGQWVQLRVVAEDRAAPDVFDAGWDLNLDVPLHAVLSAVGILAGTYSDLPWGVGTLADDHHEFRVFSRVVLGAGDAEAAADAFVGTTAPVSSAGDFHPQRYIELDEAQSADLVDDALGFLRGLDLGALTYDGPPTSSMRQPPRLKWDQHFRLFLSFLVFGLLALAKFRAAKDSVVHSTHDALDQGYNVGEVEKVDDWGIDIPDFEAQDSRLALHLGRELAEGKRDLGANPILPAAAVWESLTLLSTSLVDGGTRPEGWDPPLFQRRKVSLSPEWVQPSPRQSVASNAPELRATHTPLVMTGALREANRGRVPSVSGPVDDTGVVATGQRLATQGNERDITHLGEQLAGLGSGTDGVPTSLLDRLNALVIGGAVRSRLDFERWSEFATGPTMGEPLDWAASERRFRKRALIGLAICAGTGVLWTILAHWARRFLPGWLTLPVGLVIVVSLAVVALLAALTAFFHEYNAYMERGRRRLELRRIWGDRALEGMEAHSRLDNARRILALWTDVLATIFEPTARSFTLPTRSVPAQAPKGIAVAVPVYDKREMDDWLVDAGGKVGWRGRALSALAEECHGGDAPARDVLRILFADDGFAGGSLYAMWDRREEVWSTYARQLRGAIGGEVSGRLVEKPGRALTLITVGAADAVATTLMPFLGALWPGEEDERQSEWDPQLDHRVVSQQGKDLPSPGSSGFEVVVGEAPDVCAVVSRIQMKSAKGDTTPARRPLAEEESDESVK